MFTILEEDTCNDTYGRYRMHKALELKHENDESFKLPSERTIYRIMDTLNLSHRPKRNPKGITKADKEARKSDDLVKRNFKSDTPLTKAVTDITEIKASDGKLYVSAIFDCFDVAVLAPHLNSHFHFKSAKDYRFSSSILRVFFVLSLRRAFASICRILSRVTEYF